MLAAAKTAWLFWWFLSSKRNFLKIFEGEMLIKTQPTSFLQIFCEFLLNSKNVSINILGPDDSRQGDHQALTLSMLRLLLSKAWYCKRYMRIASTLLIVGIHWKALSKYYQMSINVPGLLSFFSFFESFCFVQISHQLQKGSWINPSSVLSFKEYRCKDFGKHLNHIMLVFIGKLS